MLTKEIKKVMAQVKDGADIYDRYVANALRALEQDHPEYIDICKPMMYDGDGTDKVPFFGAILTAKGCEALST